MNKLLVTAILSVSMITVMASAAVSPALGSIAAAFSGVNITLVRTVLTLPALFIIPFSLISGVLVRRYGNKKVLTAGIIIYVLGGIGPVFTNSFYTLLFWRAVLGIGCGLIIPVSQALIAVNFQGSLKARITAYSGAASYLMGVIASFIVAPVSAINWHYGFFIYFIAVGVLILNIAALPGDAPVKTNVAPARKFPKKVWLFIAAMFFVNIAFYAVPTNVALFMNEQAIGTNGSAGAVISAFMVAGFFAGIMLPFLQKIFKNHIFGFGVLLMALGYFILSLSSSVLFVAFGAGLVGFSFGVLFPSLLIKINTAATGAALVTALSYSGCAQFLGQFASPYLLQLFKNMLNVNSLQGDFIILALILLIVCGALFMHGAKIMPSQIIVSLKRGKRLKQLYLGRRLRGTNF